jgi:hypothetical protein
MILVEGVFPSEDCSMRMLFVLLMVLGSSLAYAQRVDSTKAHTYFSTSPSSGGAVGGAVQSMVDPRANPSLSRTAGLHDLFGSEEVPFDNNGLNWPPLPRFWWQDGYSDYLEGTFSIGLPPGVPAVTAKRAYTYKYEVGTTFHVLGSLKFKNQNSRFVLPPQVYPTNEIDLSPFVPVFKRDYVTAQEFFNVSPDNQMVGMCQYEIALYHGVSTEGGVTFVLGLIASGGRVNFTRMTVYSRLFNIKSQEQDAAGYFLGDEYSSSWYLNHECSDRFRQNTKSFVEETLAFRAMRYNAEFHPYNTCALTRPIANQTDRDCQPWHDGVGVFNFRKPGTTVGRCEQQNNGESHCVLKSKVGQKCYLYYTDGRDTLTLNLEYLHKNQRPPRRPLSAIEHGPFSLATSGVREYPCDAGLTCTMDNYDNGIATCKQLSQRDRQ